MKITKYGEISCGAVVVDRVIIEPEIGDIIKITDEHRTNLYEVKEGDEKFNVKCGPTCAFYDDHFSEGDCLFPEAKMCYCMQRQDRKNIYFEKVQQ